MLSLYLDNTHIDMPENFKINMTYQSLEISKPEAKLNNYSKTINIPGTISNNNVFGHIFRFNTNIIDGESLVGVSFDPKKRIPFTILNNGVFYESGYAQLDNITINNGIVSYSITLYGTLGSFFYNLKLNNEGNDKTLYDLYYGITDLKNNILDKDSENNNILFEFDKEFVKKSWDVILKKTTDTSEYDEISDTDIRKLICPIPCYQGYYDDFDSDVVLVNTIGLDRNSVVVKNIESEDHSAPYTPLENWSKVKLDREVSNIEINDIRSHYLPYGIRLQAIYDAIKNPENNGGFEVDDSNINDAEKRYIYEGYIMQDPIKWDDINANNINTTIQPIWSKDRTSLANRIVYSEHVDLSDYVNPNATVYVRPRIEFGYAINVNDFNTQARIYGGYRYNGDRSSPYLANHYMADSIQYFWAEALDDKGNVIQRSDIYMYGAKPTDDNDNPLYLYNFYGQQDKGGIKQNFSGYNADEVGASKEAIIYFLERNGLKIKESSLTEYEKQYYQGYYIDDDNLGVAMNRSSLEGGYILDNDLMRCAGEDIKIKIKLNNNVKQIRILSDSIVTTIIAENKDTIGTNSYWPYDNQYNRSTAQRTFTPGFCMFTRINETVSDRMYNQYYKYFERSAETTWFSEDNISGMISDATQIYDGSVETLDDRHTVDKYVLLYNTSSPYDYLISLGKMFNWKFELDPISNKIMIYSLSKYYDGNNIIDINDNIDFSNISIVPTTATSPNYNLSLSLEESYANNNWTKLYNTSYGSTNISTNYEFSTEQKGLLEDCIFNTAIPYVQRSLFYNDDSNLWPKPSLGKYADVYMWNIFDDNGEENEKRWGLLHDVEAKLSQTIQDKSPRLCFFNSDYDATKMANTLVFFNVANTLSNTKESKYQISDNIPATNQLNENNCYIYLTNDINVVTDIDNHVLSNPVIKESMIPCFNTHFNYNDVEYWGTMKAEPNEPRLNITYTNYTDMYELCWKNYMIDMYNKNNKIVTVKTHLIDLPRTAMKKFYTFKNAVWVLNKITDYNIDDYFVKCEFIQVQNINNYLQTQ